MTIVKLEKWEYEKAFEVGIARAVANWGRKDAEHYSDKDRQEPNFIALPASAICELAVAKALNRYWHGHVWHHTEHHLYRHLPDVGEFIEVRRIRTSKGVPIRRYQNGMGLAVYGAKIIDEEMRQVQILGYVRQERGWEEGIPSKFNPKNTRLFPIENLTPLKD